jgi:hypothetical protein
MSYKIIQTEDYLLIVDGSEIKDGDWYFWKVTNSVQKAKKDSLDRLPTNNGSNKIIAHLPLNGASMLDGVNTLPALPNEAQEWARSQWSCEPGDYEELYYDGLEKGFNAAKQKYQYTEEDMRKVIDMAREQYLVKYTDNEYEFEYSIDEIIQSLQQPKMPVGFSLEAKDTHIQNGVIVQSRWIGEYIY